jgi:hypothetical protein
MSYYLFTEERGLPDKVGDKLYVFAEQVVNGELHPIEFKLYLNKLKDVISECESLIEETILAEADKYKGQTVWGHKVEVTNGGRYNYDAIPQYQELKSQLKEIEKKSQMAYKMWTQGAQMLDPETGEIMPPANYVPTKSYVKLQKEKGSL